jgi:hypothetical protein
LNHAKWPAPRNLIDPAGGNSQIDRQLIFGDPQRNQKLLHKDFARMNRVKHHETLVVINDFDFAGIAVLPDKADTVLIIDADRILPLAVSGELPEPVARRHLQVIQADLFTTSYNA